MNTLWLIVELVATNGVWLFLAAYLPHEFAAKGTKLRFICRSILRPTQWLALGYFIVMIGVRAHHHEVFWTCLDIWNVIWIGNSIRKFYSSDEDDFWKRMGKKLRKLARALRDRARAMKPSLVRPVLIPAGGAA